MAVVFFQSMDLPIYFPVLDDAHGDMGHCQDWKKKGMKREQIAQAEGLVAEWKLDPAKSETQKLQQHCLMRPPIPTWRKS